MKTKKPDSDWDPKPDERVYYRSSADGQRAYLVRRNGKDMLRLDRPMEEILHPVSKVDGAVGGPWTPDVQIHPLTAHAVAKIAFVADRALCAAMGQPVLAKHADWLSQKEQVRIDFMENGPDTGDVRDDLYDAIMGTLKKLTDG